MPARIAARSRAMRCIMTTLAPPGLRADRDTLRTVAAVDRVEVTIEVGAAVETPEARGRSGPTAPSAT